MEPAALVEGVAQALDGGEWERATAAGDDSAGHYEVTGDHEVGDGQVRQGSQIGPGALDAREGDAPMTQDLLLGQRHAMGHYSVSAGPRGRSAGGDVDFGASLNLMGQGNVVEMRCCEMRVCSRWKSFLQSPEVRQRVAVCWIRQVEVRPGRLFAGEMSVDPVVHPLEETVIMRSTTRDGLKPLGCSERGALELGRDRSQTVAHAVTLEVLPLPKSVESQGLWKGRGPDRHVEELGAVMAVQHRFL